MKKQFFRHQLSTIVLVYSIVLLAMLLMWLDGQHNFALLGYLFLLGNVLLGIFLFWRYQRQKDLYRVLIHPEKIAILYEVSQNDSFSKSVAETLLKQKQQDDRALQKVEQARDQHLFFIHQWVHQMKTPLSVMELMVQANKLEASELMISLDKLHEGLDMALNMARMENFEQDFVVTKVSLKKLVQNVVTQQKRNFIRHYVYPNNQNTTDIMIETDEKWLQFILTQIVTNSIKYSPNKNAKVYFETGKLGGKTTLSIRDEGIGILSKDLPRVFQAFYTGENGRKYGEATGIGLYLVKKIADELGHEVKITSAVDEGTTVTLMF